MPGITSALCNSYKQEVLQGIHLAADVYKIAVFRSATATLDKTTTAYSTTGETTGTGYAAGGLALSGFSVTLSGDTAQLTFSAAVWNSSTMAGEGCLIYNSSRSNKAVCVLSFGGTVQDTNGTFTVTLPAALIGLT
jgi:hypothetical protein